MTTRPTRRLDDFRDLARADRRPDRPGGRGLVLAEGTVVVRRLLASPYPPRALLGVPRRVDELAPELAGARRARLRRRRRDDGGGRRLPPQPGRARERRPGARPPTSPPCSPAPAAWRVLEGVNDHENLGALFRNAAALGVDAVLLAPGCADPLYRRSVRVSMGHVLRVPFARPGLADGLVTALRGAGFVLGGPDARRRTP